MFYFTRICIKEGVTMFNWYFNDCFIENEVLFITSLLMIICMVAVTIYFVRKELKAKNVNK